jgi:hypothetical protein
MCRIKIILNRMFYNGGKGGLGLLERKIKMEG